MGLARRGLARDPEGQLEVGGRGAMAVLDLAPQPVAHARLEARALLLPQRREARRVLRHQGLEPLLRDLVQAPAEGGRVAQGKLAPVAPLAQEALCCLVEQAAALQWVEPPALLRLLHRLQAQDAFQGSSLFATSAASASVAPSRGAKATRPS